MDEQLNLLIELQEMDSVIRGLVAKKQQLPKILADLEQKRAAQLANLDDVKAALATAQKNKRDRDQTLEAGTQKVERLKARTSEIKNNKEYQALLKEIEGAQQENKAIEDEILVLMEKIESASAAVVAAESNARNEETAIAAERKEQEASIAKVEEQLKAAEEEKKKIASRVKPSIFEAYQRLIDTKGGTAIAEARGESCSGCFMSIPPQVFVNVKKNENIINCPQCGRFLYYKEAIEQKTT